MQAKEILDLVTKIDVISLKDAEARKEWYDFINKNRDCIGAEFVELLSKLDYLQIEVVTEAIKYGLNIEQIKVLANPEFDEKFMKNLVNGLYYDDIEPEKMKLYAKKEYKDDIIGLNKLAKYLDIQILKKYLNADLKMWQKLVIFRFLSCYPDIPQERVDVMCNKEFFPEQLEQLKKYVLECKRINLEQLELIANPRFNSYQMEEIFLGIIYNLKKEQIEFYAKPEISSIEMSYIRLGFVNNLPIKAIEYYSSKEFTSEAVEEIYKCLIEGISLEKTEFIVELASGDSEKIYLYKEISGYGFSNEDMQEIVTASKHPSREELKQFLRLLRWKIPCEQVKSYAISGFNSYQLEEICEGYEGRLSKEQIEVYAKKEIHYTKMKALRKCFDKGYPIKLVEIMAEPHISVSDIEKDWENDKNLRKLFFQIFD